MKYVIALNYIEDDSNCDIMLNTAYHYGLMYIEYETDNAPKQMLFFIKDEIANKGTSYFLGNLLCCIFETTYSNFEYSYPEEQPCYEIGIYDILFAFLSYVRSKTGEKHYKEQLRKAFNELKVDMNKNLPAIHMLKDNSYTLTPTERVKIGYEMRTVLAPYKLEGKTKKEQSMRGNNRRATYRNFKWENLYESCFLYRNFVEGHIECTEEVYFLARSICGAEKGKNKFLEIMNSEPNNNKHYKNIHWKEILTAIIKDDIPIASCDSCEYCDSCCHADNMLSTAKPKKQEIRILKKDRYVTVDEAYQELQKAFHNAVEANDNKIYIINGQTALGKTSTYIEYMKECGKPVLIAVPTHQLKEQIICDSKNAGINDICGTPDIITYGISDEIIDEMNEIYRIGAGQYALKFLSSKLMELDKKSSDYDKIKNYLKECKDSTRFKGHIITTHAKLLHMPQIVFESHEVIIDEDILRTVLRTESIDRKEVINIKNSVILPEYITSRLGAICMKRGYHVMDELNIFSDEEQMEKLKGRNADIYGLLNSRYIHITNDKITFLVEEKLPDCKMIIMSATVNYELYKMIYSERSISYYECSKAEYKGKVVQYTDSSYSRYSLNENNDKKKMLIDISRNSTVITFKSIEREFNTSYHFGNVEGMNNLKGKNLMVIGLPNLDETVYCLYGMRAGAELKWNNMYPHRIKYKDKSFYLNTYKDRILQLIQTWLISSQLEQAVGRARLLREECTVTVFSGFPVEQAEYKSDIGI